MNAISYHAELYEVASQSFQDIPLDKQIALKINDWAAEDHNGRIFYGRTAQQASDECHNFNTARADFLRPASLTASDKRDSEEKFLAFRRLGGLTNAV